MAKLSDMADSTAGTEFLSLVEEVVEASEIPTKRRSTSIKSTVDRLSSTAYDRGILPDDLSRLIELITTPSHLDQASIASFIRNLYPVRNVPAENILQVVGSLGHGELKPSLAIQSQLLRWLIMVYHILESPGTLSQAYAVLFNLLDTAAIRPQLCHLLALITRRKHVRPFRIQILLALSRQAGNDPPLIGLLRVYKNYYPEIIVGAATKGRASTFKHPDPQWRTRLDEIQEAHMQQSKGGHDRPRNGFRVNHMLDHRRKAAAVPAVQTLHAQETSVTLEEIDDAESFVARLEKIELPNQLVAVLADPLLQKLMLLRPNDEARQRIDSWIAACTADIASGEAPSLLMEMMEIIHSYVLSTKELSPIVLQLCREALNIWDGKEKQDLVLETLSFVQLKDFQDLYPRIFEPLERSLLDNTPASQLALLKFYTGLLYRWTVSLRSMDEVPTETESSINGLVVHVNRLSLTLLQTSPTTSTHLTILDFYEQLASLMSSPGSLKHLKITLTLPPGTLVYTLLFSPSVAVVSRLCAVLATYRRTLEAIMDRDGRPLTAYERDHLIVFNGFVMDICNCLWRSRAFVTTDPEAQGCGVSEPVVHALADYVAAVNGGDLSLAAAFSLSHSPALCLQSITYVRLLEDEAVDRMDGALQRRHPGPVTQESLAVLSRDGGLSLTWQEYRSGVLKYLEEHDAGGIPDLMYNTMKNLMSSRPHRPADDGRQ